jgi:PAS domain S-box-containing protein
MDTAPVMIWVAGKDKRCTWFNRPWLMFTGRSLAQEVGNGWTDGVHQRDIDSCLRTYVSHFDARTNFRMQYRLRRHDGVHRWIDDTGIPRFDHTGDFAGYIGSCIDIHDQREIQSEIHRRVLEIAETNRQADAAGLAAAIAHEIRQPLAGIVARANAGARWLARETPEVEKAKVIFDEISRTGHRVSEIIGSIQALTKREQQTASISVNKLIAEVLDVIEETLQKNQIVVIKNYNDALPDVEVDRIQLQQVMLNLIRNAIEAMSCVPANSRTLRLMTEVENPQRILITVQDSGPGIEASNIERIFERFFTTKTQGMGMGLAICRSVIEAHNGRLWAEAGVDQGSVFRISLPIGPV